MTTKQQLQQQLAYAKEQLMIADSMEAQVRWGLRCDQIEAGIRDLDFTTAKTFNVFHRTWWKKNPARPDGREPGMGRKTYLAHRVTEEEARAICEQWNATHDPGHLSRMAEYENQETDQ